MSSLLIKNGMLYDGLGGEGFPADLFIAGDRIKGIGKIDAQADEIIDAGGKAVCPGFVDIHRHCDAKFLQNGDFGDTELAQGITTVVAGNCGMSLTPSPKDAAGAKEMYDFMEPVLGSGARALALSSYPGYLDRLDRASLPFNTASMIGTGSVRITVKGFSDTPFVPDELKTAERLVEEALEAGAAGVSTGIMYLPECYGTVGEYVGMLKPAGRMNRVVASHIRGEGDSLVSSVNEILAIGAGAGCPVEISHFKACGIDNWRRSIHEAINLIEKARSEGQDVTCDFYPYEGGSTALTTMLPPTFLAGSLTAALKRLGTQEGVEAFRRASRRSYTDWDNYGVTLGWDRILISSVFRERNRKFLGLTVAEASRRFGFEDAEACAAYLMHDEEGKTAIINFSMCQDDIDAVARLPYSIIISDAIYADTDTPHPRMYGAFPQIIREYVNERGVLSLGKAIRKMTALPAKRMKLKDRGVLAVGAYADVIMFDPERFRDNATFTDPARLSEGLSLSVINGRVVWRDGRREARGAGRNLRIFP